MLEHVLRLGLVEITILRSKKMERSPVLIRTLGHDDVLPFREVRLHGLLECPLAFGQTADAFLQMPDELVSSTYLQNSDDRFTLGAFTDNYLVGIGGLFRDPKKTIRHNATVWGVYLLPASRGAGIGTLLMKELIERARGLPDVGQVHLKVAATQTSARALYEKMGFVAWGTEPRARRVGEDFIDEVHMLLRLG